MYGGDLGSIFLSPGDESMVFWMSRACGVGLCGRTSWSWIGFCGTSSWFWTGSQLADSTTLVRRRVGVDGALWLASGLSLRWRRFCRYWWPLWSVTSYERYGKVLVTVPSFHSRCLVLIGCILTLSPIRRVLRSLCSFMRCGAGGVWRLCTEWWSGASFASDVGSKDLVRRPNSRCAGLVVWFSDGVFLRFNSARNGSSPSALHFLRSRFTVLTAASAAPLLRLYPGPRC